MYVQHTLNRNLPSQKNELSSKQNITLLYTYTKSTSHENTEAFKSQMELIENFKHF